jgi:RNA polymerase sigma-70 factor (ECF subfamily)
VDIDDEDLIARSRAGDRLALQRLITRHRPQLLAFCARFRDDPDDRQELGQLVMIRVWRGINRFDGRSSLSTWLYQIVRNAAASEYARQSRLPLPLDLTARDHAPAVVPTPEDVVVARDEIRRALAEAAPPFRMAVQLVDVWGCPHAEAAALCGVGEATIRTRLWRGRSAARAALAA